MPTRRFLFVFAYIQMSCAAAVQQPASEPANDGAKIEISQALKQRPRPEMVVWMTYAATTAVGFVTTKGMSRGPDDFMPEVVGRTILAMSWKKEQQKPNPPPASPYLDQLVALDDAGFTSEHVLTTFAKPGWTIPKVAIEKLKLAAYEAWMAEHWQGERAVTLAHYRYTQDPATTEVIGERANVSCTEVLAAVGAKHAVWVATREQLLAFLTNGTMTKDVVWVSANAAACFSKMPSNRQ